MNVEIITVGDEILIGQIVDTNSQWIATELNKIGVEVYQITSIQDDRTHILQALSEAEQRADLVLITGGLGPTKDDITKSTLATYFKDTLIYNDTVVQHIKKLFKKYDIPFGRLNEAQGMLPSKATILPNKFGTAPGMWFYENETVFVSLPGVPNEMKGLMKNEVIPKIQKQFRLPFIIHKTIMTYGMGESAIAERIESFENNLPEFIKLAYLPNYGKVRLRLSARGNDRNKLIDALQNQISILFSIIPDIITGFDDGGKIEETIGAYLKERKQTISTAESVTGGKISSTIVSVPGSSSYFKGSFVTYTAESKEELLKVSPETIALHTVVSEEVAKEMAKNAKAILNTDYAIAVTGNAGPTTDNNDKDVGLVYIAIASPNSILVENFNFGKPRGRVIDKTVNKALEMLQKQILKN